MLFSVEQKGMEIQKMQIIFPQLYKFAQNYQSLPFSILQLALTATPCPFRSISSSKMENDHVFLQSFSKMKDIKSGNFANKLHCLLANPSHDEIITWADNKTAIEVVDQLRMESDILPLYFRQTKFESFVRQLNLYGFRKVKTQQALKFTHPLLQQGLDLTSISTAKVSKRKSEVIEEGGDSEPQARVVIDLESSANEVEQDGVNTATVGQNRSSTEQIKNNPVKQQEACNSPFYFPQMAYFAISPYLFWNFPPFAASSNGHQLSLQADGLI